MLQKIHDNTQGIVAKIFVIVLIAIFAFWGLESIVGNIITSTSTITVNGVEINEADIEALTQNKAQEFYSSLGEDADVSAFDPSDFRQSAIDELIQREILVQSAVESGMAVSTNSLNTRMRQTPDFQIDGVFNAERATLLLRNLGHTPNSYRATLQKETILNQMLTAYSASGFTTSNELAQLAALTHQKRNARYAALNLGGLEGIEVTDAEIETYYQDNQDSFLNEEQVQIEFVELDKESLLNEIAVSDEQVQEAYEEERAAFEAQTERRASHILFEATTEEEFTAAQAQAAEVKARLDAGEDFATLAAEVSDDTGSAVEGGDVGYTTGDNFVEEFETALRNLAVNQVSDPVKTEFGVHLIKLTEVAETAIPTFDERREEIARDLKSSQAETLFLAKSDELGNLAFESPDLETPASTMGLMVQRSDWFGRAGGTGITTEAEVINAAFSAEVIDEGLNSEMIQIGDSRSVVLRVVEHQLPVVQELDAVRGEIQVLLQLEKMKAQVRTSGEALLKSLEEGGNVDGLLQAQSAAWTQLDAVERGARDVDPEISEKLFSIARPSEGGTEVEGFELSDGRYLIVELQSVVDGTAADFAEGEEQNMRNFISQQAAANDFAGFMENLEKRAEIDGLEEPEVAEF
ncbi:MAG: SurA N-terminal domain-containing protein [Pseudomonadota bacterium]